MSWPDRSFWDNWTREEIEYYSNAERFPILKTSYRKIPRYLFLIRYRQLGNYRLCHQKRQTILILCYLTFL
jgi:hypothetical protein